MRQEVLRKNSPKPTPHRFSKWLPNHSLNSKRSPEPWKQICRNKQANSVIRYYLALNKNWKNIKKSVCNKQIEQLRMLSRKSHRKSLINHFPLTTINACLSKRWKKRKRKEYLSNGSNRFIR